MCVQNLGNSLMKWIPGCENLYVASNGHLRERNFAGRRSNAQFQAAHSQNQFHTTHSQNQANGTSSFHVAAGSSYNQQFSNHAVQHSPQFGYQPVQQTHQQRFHNPSNAFQQNGSDLVQHLRAVYPYPPPNCFQAPPGTHAMSAVPARHTIHQQQEQAQFQDLLGDFQLPAPRHSDTQEEANSGNNDE